MRRAKEMVLLLLMFQAATGEAKRGLPPDIKACTGEGRDLNECIIKTANQIIPRVVAGELKSLGLGDINPIRIPRMAVESENKFLPGFRFELLNTEHRGWDKAQLLYSRAEPEKYRFGMSMFLPEYELTANRYDLAGNLLFFEMKGSGSLVVTFYNNRYHVDVLGEPYQRKGKRYMRVTNFTIVANIEDMHLKVTSLFDSQPLSDAMVNFINQNSKILAELGAPMSQDLFGTVYSTYIQRIFDSVPYDDLFPNAVKEDIDSLKRHPDEIAPEEEK